MSHQPANLFHRFQSDTTDLSLPERFTFPFYYQPHPLCELATKELQHHLETQSNWQHDFGVEHGTIGTGKMFGVLVAQSPDGELGYFSAFSGKIADQNLLPGFVPPVFDMLAEHSFFRSELAEITAVSQEIETLESTPLISQLTTTLNQYQTHYKSDEDQLRTVMIDNRAERKVQRREAEQTLTKDALNERLDQLGKQSVAEKNQLKYLKLEWEEKISHIEHSLAQLTTVITKKKQQRRQMSNALQDKLFNQYCFLNANGEQQSLKAIFASATSPIPPAGAGECAAPKLLHYAYLHGFAPLAMAEFWWGASPKSEIRQHKQFYPSCNSKCQPILGHMLQGLLVDDNPLEESWAKDKELEIIYEDETMVVVNKPSGLLSVPGKTIKDSAYTRLQAQYPEAENVFVIHRLDMATSGLLVFALTKRANKSLQKQFISRQVEKRYVALLEGEVSESCGTITLPLRGDPDDRPRQLVCEAHGKPSQTDWELIGTTNQQSKLRLYPRTGRTHQLRVHCAHHLGLNTPMVGDTLYGDKAERLHLHAEYLAFNHPYNHESMVFEVPAEF